MRINNRIGFIGLGIMGKPMAKNLIKSGYSLVVFDINKESVKEIVMQGAKEGFSPKDVARRTDIIITMLPNSPEVNEVVLGQNGIIEGASEGTILIDMSSIAPLASSKIEMRLKEKGIIMIDAPVSGGEPKAVDGTLSIMVGGCPDAFEIVKDILMVMGSNVTHVGKIGSGNTVKLANQIIVALNIAAMSEAMALAVKAGVDPEKVYSAIRGGLAGSAVLDAKMPLILNNNFKPGFKMELHIKDLKNAIETAQKIDAPIYLTKQVLEYMETLNADGKGMYDHGCLIRFYEKLSGIEVRKK